MTLSFSDRQTLLHQPTTSGHEIGAKTPIKAYDIIFHLPKDIFTSTNRLLNIKWVRKDE